MARRFETVSFLSDLGTADETTGVVRAVLRDMAPHTVVVDLTHGIPPYDVRAGSLALARAIGYVPPGVIIAAVDAGPANGRSHVAIEVADGSNSYRHARPLIVKKGRAESLAAGQAVIGTTPPDFTLLDRQGKPVRLSQYRGKPLLVSFIYTGCFEICPTSTRTLHEAVKGLDKLLSPNQFNVVSIGFNQPADSPVALRSSSRRICPRCCRSATASW